MKLPVSDEAIDSFKKTTGTLLLGLGAISEIFLEPASQLGRAGSVAGMIGGILLGLGLMNARGKSAAALIEQAFGTTKPSEVQKEAIAVAQQVASLAPPPAGSASDNAITWPKQDRPEQRTSLPGDFPADRPPPPRSKP